MAVRNKLDTDKMQSEELSDPDQDFQPNKRARVSAPPAPSMEACCQAVSHQNRQLLLGTVRDGKENLLPARSVAPGSTGSQSLIDLSNEELEPDLLPVRKAKCLLPSAITPHLPPAPAADQHTHPSVAVRAFFTRRQSWSTLERSKHPECTETLSNAVSARLRPLDISQTTGSAVAELLPSSAACLNATSSAAVNPVSQVQPSEHVLALAEPLPVQTQQPALTNSLSMPIAAPATAAAAEPSLESLPGDFIVLDSSGSDADSDASDDAELADMQTQAEASHQAVVAWLHQHNLSAYITAFKQAEVDLDFIPWLNDNDLQQMGVTALGPRRKLLAAATKLAAEAAESTRLAEQSGCEHDAVPAECRLEPDIAGAADRYTFPPVIP